jgi:hypothetical protein
MTVYPHRIRLRGPWECEPLARLRVGPDGQVEPLDGPMPPRCRMTMPCCWDEGGLAGFAGRVRFLRRFGYPGRIDAHERVWLTFAGVHDTAEVWLNGRPLGRRAGADGPFEFEVTDLLRERNELAVIVEAPAGGGGLWGEVALEVRCTAFLRGLRLWATDEGDLHAAGEVVGTAERALELYVLLDNATVAYATVEAAPAGKPFEVVAPAAAAERPAPPGAEAPATHEVRVELVNGATVWYTLGRSFIFPKDLPGR